MLLSQPFFLVLVAIVVAEPTKLWRESSGVKIHVMSLGVPTFKRALSLQSSLSEVEAYQFRIGPVVSMLIAARIIPCFE